MATSNCYVPSYWVHKIPVADPKYFLEDDPVSKFNICAIVESTWDSDKVGAGRDAEKLKHSGIEIIKVARVENPALFHSYSQRRREFEQRRLHCRDIENIPQQLADFNKKERSTAVNEYYLFHGTDRACSIADTGFLTRFADPENLYGKAIYFTDSFEKADQYSDDPHNRTPPGTQLTVIMARVLLGRTYKCDKKDAIKLKCLPCTQHTGTCLCGPLQRYDSVESTDLLFREFAVYDGTQCYPEYIIIYKRTGKQEIPTQNEVSKGRNKNKKRSRRRGIKNKQPVTWQQVVMSISALDGNAHATGITKLTSFWQKTKTDRPEYEFKENTRSAENRWECVCRIHFPVEANTVARGRRKKLSKRLAAEQMFQKLKSLMETHPLCFG